jgi:hypothetical protein
MQDKATSTKMWKDAGLDLPTSMELSGCSPEQVEKARAAADEAAAAKTAQAKEILNAARNPVAPVKQ